MFKKDKDNSKISFLSSLLELEGNLVTTGDLRIEAKFTGDIHCEVADTGKESVITGNLVGKSLVVDGNVKGGINANDSLTLLSNSKVNGSVKTANLTVNEGAWVECVIEVLSPNNNPKLQPPEMKEITEPIAPVKVAKSDSK